MPYDPSNPPKKIRNLSAKKQRQWIAVFNSATERGADEESAHKQAWGAVKKEVALESLEDFCEDVVKMAPIHIPGVQESMGQRKRVPDARQWHEIASDPGYMRRVIGGKVERKKKQVVPAKEPAGKKRPAAGAKMSKYENLPATTGYSEGKIDSKTGKFVVTGTSPRGKPLPRVIIDLDDPKLDEKLPSEWKRHLRRIASELNLDELSSFIRKMVIAELEDFSVSVSGDLEEETPEILEKKDKKKEPKTIDVTTPEGARAIALGLTRMFGGWNGGCRLSPSANRVDTYHVTVFCETPKELGQRIMDLKAHLLAQGYKEESEGIFRNGNRAVYQGRSYSRRKGNRPLAFMVTIRSKN